MTIQQLRYAIAIAEAGSFSRAAETLYIAQPSLSGAIQELEREAGIQIFRRGGRGVTLTREGATFLSLARGVCAPYEELLDKYGKGSVRKKHFAVSTQHYSFAVKAFVDTVKPFDLQEYEFAIRETQTRRVIEDVGAGRSEVGVLYLSDYNRRPLQKLLTENRLAFIPLLSCPACVYLWRKHPLAARASLSLSDLAPYPCLTFEQGDSAALYFAEEILAENTYPRLIRACDRSTMLNLMVGLNGYTLCSGLICEELNGDDFTAIPFADSGESPDSVMEIGYLVRKNQLPGELGERYIQTLRRCLDAAVIPPSPVRCASGG